MLRLTAKARLIFWLASSICTGGSADADRANRMVETSVAERNMAK